MRDRAAYILLASGAVIMLIAIWLQLTSKTIIGYTGPGTAYAPANRIDRFNSYSLFLISLGCLYYGWTLIKKKKEKES